MAPYDEPVEVTIVNYYDSNAGKQHGDLERVVGRDAGEQPLRGRRLKRP